MPKKNHLKFSFYIRFTALSIFILMSGFYLFQITQNSTAKYDINRLKENIIDLKNKEEEFKIEIAHAESMGVIEKKVEKLFLVKVDSSKYLIADEQKMAYKAE